MPLPTAQHALTLTLFCCVTAASWAQVCCTYTHTSSAPALLLVCCCECDANATLCILAACRSYPFHCTLVQFSPISSHSLYAYGFFKVLVPCCCLYHWYCIKFFYAILILCNKCPAALSSTQLVRCLKVKNSTAKKKQKKNKNHFHSMNKGK